MVDERVKPVLNQALDLMCTHVSHAEFWKISFSLLTGDLYESFSSKQESSKQKYTVNN